MKPRNFPERKIRRQADAKWRRGEQHLTPEEVAICAEPKDIRIRIGKDGRSRGMRRIHTVIEGEL